MASTMIRSATPADIDALADVLLDCVEGGASVSFMWPFPRDRAVAFWRDVFAAAETDGRVVFAAVDGSEIVGTVQVVPAWPENQPHRADVAKMLVRRAARRRGVGAALLRAAEDAGRRMGKTLLVLDTVTGSPAERLYERMGWRRCGVIPDYALWPDGRPCDATVFYRDLRHAGSA